MELLQILNERLSAGINKIPPFWKENANKMFYKRLSKFLWKRF